MDHSNCTNEHVSSAFFIFFSTHQLLTVTEISSYMGRTLTSSGLKRLVVSTPTSSFSSSLQTRIYQLLWSIKQPTKTVKSHLFKQTHTHTHTQNRPFIHSDFGGIYFLLFFSPFFQLDRTEQRMRERESLNVNFLLQLFFPSLNFIFVSSHVVAVFSSCPSVCLDELDESL